MKKSEALNIAKDQMENHRLQISGAWSVSDEVAKEVAESLGVDMDDAFQYVDDMAMEEYHDELYSEYQRLKRIMGEDAFEIFEQSDAAEVFEEYFNDRNSPISGTYNEYFWSYLLDNASE